MAGSNDGENNKPQDSASTTNDDALLFDEATVLSRADEAQKEDDDIDFSEGVGNAEDSGNENIQASLGDEQNIRHQQFGAGQLSPEDIDVVRQSIDEGGVGIDSSSDTSLGLQQGAPSETTGRPDNGSSSVGFDGQATGSSEADIDAEVSSIEPTDNLNLSDVSRQSAQASVENPTSPTSPTTATTVTSPTTATTATSPTTATTVTSPTTA
ncbi:hypothetical protein SAMN02745127_02109, partial [Oceanospirillum multiglobuliferum]